MMESITFLDVNRKHRLTFSLSSPKVTCSLSSASKFSLYLSIRRKLGNETIYMAIGVRYNRFEKMMATAPDVGELRGNRSTGGTRLQIATVT